MAVVISAIVFTRQGLALRESSSCTNVGAGGAAGVVQVPTISISEFGVVAGGSGGGGGADLDADPPK